MDGYSAHADQKDLLDFAGEARRGRSLKFRVDGEPRPQRALSDRLREQYGLNGRAPSPGDRATV